MPPPLLDRNLLYVTGKGGVGKTTVAAALGLAAARRGRRTIVCEVAEQTRLRGAFARHKVSSESESQLAENLWAVTIDPDRALDEWLHRQLGGGPMFRALARSPAFQYLVAAAPGVKELITIGKVYEIALPERWVQGSRSYDLVIVDAPASGHGLAMLQTPQTFGEIARVGTIRRQAGKIRALLSDRERTGYVGVALPEEMPVTETLELQDRLRDVVGLSLELVVVNSVLPERLTAADAARVREVAAADEDAAASLRAALLEYDRAHAQRPHVRRLRHRIEGSVVTLPFLFEPEVGLSSFERLADELTKRLP